MKHILPYGEFDEQQLSGHGWLMRGLCEYYEYTNDASALSMAKRICENLFLPLTGRMDSYPAGRTHGGQASGNIDKVIEGWHLSTDTGCVFIPMDGLSRLWELTQDERIGKLLYEMYALYDALDLKALKAQTHASLSAVRGILRMYKITGDAKLLNTAKRVFSLYEECGMTAVYANCNWFGRPEWTEPCAIIDSFIAAMRLFEYTDEPEYALFARKVYYNAICRAQRDNGGFGCDSCPGYENGSKDLLSASIYEAFWCCTMRGGEGLPMAARFIADVKDGEARILMPCSARINAKIGEKTVVLRIDAENARNGVVKVRSEGETAPSISVSLLLPNGEYIKQPLPESGKEIVFTWDTPLRLENRRLMWGETLLGTFDSVENVDTAKLSARENGFVLGEARFIPNADSTYIEKTTLCEKPLRVLFG